MWDERFSAEGYFYGTAPNSFLAEHLSVFPRGGRVLCLAEGEGRNAVTLAEAGCRVTAVDISAAGLAKARRLADERGVDLETLRADLADYDPGEARWEGIVSIWAHLPPQVRSALHRRCVRALAPGGVFLLEAYTPRQLRHGTGGPKDPTLLMTLEALREELAGLELLVAREVEREIHEGTGHNGPSATVQILARKPAGT